MPSHLSSIGFTTKDHDDFLRFTERANQFGRKFRFPGGLYKRWSDKSGAELWLEKARWGVTVGCDPHFAGSTHIDMTLTARIERPAGKVPEGAFSGWVGGDTGEAGGVPLIFDSPNFRLHQALALPARVQVQIAAFAHHLTLYENDEAYSMYHIGALGMKTEWYLPISYCESELSDNEKPAEGIFSGHIVETASLMNEQTGLFFQWAKVRTLGGEIDVVADPFLLPGPLVRGEVVRGEFWLSGLIASEGKS